MSTRCGDIDPAVVLRLMAQTSGDAEAVGTLLNKRSGVLGLSGSSADIRDILTELSPENGWHGQALRTAQTYLWRIRKYLGAYLAVVGRANAVIFTDTIGETVPAVRWSVCTDMAQFGLRIDPERNEQADGLPADIAADESPTRILVIRTNEELAIARQSYEMLADGPGLSERRAS